MAEIPCVSPLARDLARNASLLLDGLNFLG
jgi:hypothetical protein